MPVRVCVCTRETGSHIVKGTFLHSDTAKRDLQDYDYKARLNYPDTIHEGDEGFEWVLEDFR